MRDKSHNYLSPHVQVSFPVTDRTNFRLSYSHQVQTPDFALLLGGINTDLNNTNTNQVYGADLDFGKTIAFEFGIRHAFSDDMVLDVAAYNKDIVSDPAARLVTLFDPTLGRDNDFRILTNLDFGNVRGVDVRLDRRFGNYFNGTVSYSYQSAKNTGSDPFTYTNYGSRIVNQVGGNNGAQPPPQGILATDNSRPHTLASAFSISLPGDWRKGSMAGSILGNVSVFSTFRYTSGTAYTKCGISPEEQSVLSIENCVRLFPEGINTQRLPALKEFNAKLTKGFGLGGLDLTAYLDVRNLFNWKNVIQVFAINGDTKNDQERADNLLADLDDLATERDANEAVGPNGAIVLPAAHEDCNAWVSSKAERPAAANCMYLIRAEQRFGNGDGTYTVEEQGNAINALYDAGRGEQETDRPGSPRAAGLRDQLLTGLPSAGSPPGTPGGGPSRMAVFLSKEDGMLFSRCQRSLMRIAAAALALSVAASSVAMAKPKPGKGFRLLSSAVTIFQTNRVQCRIFSDGSICATGSIDGGRRHLAPRHRGSIRLRVRHQHRRHHRGG